MLKTYAYLDQAYKAKQLDMLLNLTLYNGQRMSSYHIIMAILLWQFCGRGEQGKLEFVDWSQA